MFAFLAFAARLYFTFANGQQEGINCVIPCQNKHFQIGSLSPCLQRCLEPMARIEKSISNMYRNYEKARVWLIQILESPYQVCEKLEWSAKCAQSCQLEDRGAFFQYTTFYRIHCVDFEEGAVGIW